MNSIKSKFPSAVGIALLSAALFGASTPLAKLLTGHISPQLIAGLLYLGSGAGLLLLILCRQRKNLFHQIFSQKIPECLSFIGSIAAGGVIAPLLLMVGLKTSNAGEVALLLNLEAVFTAILAWFIFKENFDRRVFSGVVLIVFGSIILCWQPFHPNLLHVEGALAVIGACFCWALDNNLTRNIAAIEPMEIACTKGLVSGLVNTIIALLAGSSSFINPMSVAGAMTIGFFAYGLSLVLFIKALRRLGTARTGAYFSTAPFVGAIISHFMFREPISPSMLIAAACMGAGVWLHLTEKHEHEHSHAEEEHEHMHVHDEHHQHEHDHDVAEGEEHSHWHKHQSISHSHPHYPDLHHRHEH